MTDDISEIIQQLAVPEYAPRPKPTIIPGAAWNDTPLFCLRLNDEWVSHVLGVLTALDQSDTWIGTEEEIFAVRQQVNEIMLALMQQCEEPMDYPQHATLWHDEAIVTNGGALASGALTDTYYGIFSYQSSGADGDSFEQSIVLDAGDYVFHVQGGTTNAHGKIDWSIDAESPFISGQDWYSSGTVSNVYKTGTLTIATAGRHTLKGTVNGKHASALAYFIPLTKYWFEYVP